MSVQALTWVLEHSEEKNGARLVLISLANHAGPDGGSAFPSAATIMRETRLSHGAVAAALKGLRERGAVVEEGRRRHGTIVYRLVMGVRDLDTSTSNLDPSQSRSRTQAVQDLYSGRPGSGHEPSSNPSEKSSGSAARRPAETAGDGRATRQVQNAAPTRSACATCDGFRHIVNEDTRTASPCPDCHPSASRRAA